VPVVAWPGQPWDQGLRESSRPGNPPRSDLAWVAGWPRCSAAAPHLAGGSYVEGRPTDCQVWPPLLVMMRWPVGVIENPIDDVTKVIHE